MHGSRRWDMSRLNELIVRACSPKAEDRYPNAGLMLEDLDACAELRLDGILEEAYDPATTTASIPQPRREFDPAIGAAGESMIPRAGTMRPRSEAVEVALAFARTIPWILGFIVLMFAMSYAVKIFMPY
jgi:hypothetical protein